MINLCELKTTCAWTILTPGVCFVGFILGTLVITKYISCGPWFQSRICIKVYSIISLWKILIPWRSQFGPQALDMQDLCRGPLDSATYQLYKLWASWCQIRICFKVYSIIVLWIIMIPWRSQFGPQELNWQDLGRGPLNFTTYQLYKL